MPTGRYSGLGQGFPTGIWKYFVGDGENCGDDRSHSFLSPKLAMELCIHLEPTKHLQI